MALSYLSAWAPQASKRNSNFEVKRNRLLVTPIYFVTTTVAPIKNIFINETESSRLFMYYDKDEAVLSIFSSLTLLLSQFQNHCLYCIALNIVSKCSQRGNHMFSKQPVDRCVSAVAAPQASPM